MKSGAVIFILLFLVPASFSVAAPAGKGEDGAYSVLPKDGGDGGDFLAPLSERGRTAEGDEETSPPVSIARKEETGGGKKRAYPSSGAGNRTGGFVGRRSLSSPTAEEASKSFFDSLRHTGSSRRPLKEGTGPESGKAAGDDESSTGLSFPSGAGSVADADRDEPFPSPTPRRPFEGISGHADTVGDFKKTQDPPGSIDNNIGPALLSEEAAAAESAAGPALPPEAAGLEQSDWPSIDNNKDGLSLLKAVQAEDIALFDHEMKQLLSGPFSHWVKALTATDSRGQNIFHKTAQVKKNREEFARRIKFFIELISPSSPGTIDDLFFQLNYSLSAEISSRHKTSPSGPMDIGRAVSGGAEDLREKLLKILQEQPAVNVLRSLHETMGSGNVPAASQNPFPLSRREELKDFIDVKVTVNFETLQPPYLEKDHQGRTPIALADRSGNVPVYNILKKTDSFKPYRTSMDNRAFTIWAVIGAAGGWLSAHYWMDMWLMSMGLPVGPDNLRTGADVIKHLGAPFTAGFLTGITGVYGSRCYRFFRRRIKNLPPS